MVPRAAETDTRNYFSRRSDTSHGSPSKIHKTSRTAAIIASLLVLFWGTLIGLGYATGSALIPPVALMIVALAVYRLTAPKASDRKP